MLRTLFVTTFWATLWTLSVASPFEITDNYVQHFREGLETLKAIAEKNVFAETSYDPTKYNETSAKENAKEFDFIVIGGGTSGAVIANRLSEVPEWNVLLLEAGGPETPFTQVPAYAGYLQSTPYNWGYTTTPQHTWCLGMEDKKCAWASGRAMGGSSAIDSMVYSRGNRLDFDKWSDQGNDGWCYNDVLPYFKKAENSHLHSFDRKFHNQGGNLHVEDAQFSTPLADIFLEAGKELGYKTLDYNGKEQLGFGPVQTTTRHGKRNSVATGYLEPIVNRKNLKVLPFSHVVQILIGDHTKEAYGVKFVKEGTLAIAKATKEVILAAGTFNSAQLLLLSGVGPKEDLKKLQIPTLSDLPVGKNLRDHIAFLGLTFTLNESLPLTKEQINAPDNLVPWLKEGKGPLTSIAGVEALGYVKTDASKEKLDVPDIELMLWSKSLATDQGAGLKNFRISKDIYDALWQPLEAKHTWSIVPMLTRPKSAGTLTLKTNDPFHWPALDSNQLSDVEEQDIHTMLAGVKKALDVAHTKAFEKYGAYVNENAVPGCDGHKFGTDEYWTCAIRHLSVSMRHQSGTCKMGPSNDKEAVVDNKLNVHGVHKLRVADASVIPVPISGHIAAATVMIGEKAADLVKDTWK